MTEPSLIEDVQKNPVNATALAEFERRVPSNPRRMVFHYTSLTGLHGIISTRRIWATDIEYLNDPSELTYATDIIQEVVEHLRPQCTDDIRERLDGMLERVFRVSSRYDVFMASFSERGDLLSQWVGYTPNAAGVSLGLSLQYIRKQSIAGVVRVLYGASKQRETVAKVLRYYISALAALPSGEMTALAILNAGLGLLLQLCRVSFKDPVFATEREWRVIVLQRRGEKNVLHRVVGGILVPYVEVPFAGVGTLLPVRVTLGPALERTRNEKSINHFLANNNVRSKIKHSTVPYRNVH